MSAGSSDHPVGRFLARSSDVLAVLGGLSLIMVILVTVISVVGRTVFNRPLLGDAEIVEIGCAFAVFSFLPYCQMRGANIVVDFFTKPLPKAVRDWMDSVCSLLFAAVVALLTWRLALGGLDAYRNGDFSTFLQIPAWWGYLAAFVSCLLWAATCLHTSITPLIGISAGEDTKDRSA